MQCSLESKEQMATRFLHDVRYRTDRLESWLKDERLDLHALSERTGITPIEGLVSLIRWSAIESCLNHRISLLSQDAFLFASLNWGNESGITFCLSKNPPWDRKVTTLEGMPFNMLWHAMVFASRSCKIAKQIVAQGVDIHQKSEAGHTIFELLEPDERMREQYARLVQKLNSSSKIPRLYGELAARESTKSCYFSEPWIEVPPLGERLQQLARGEEPKWEKILRCLKEVKPLPKVV